MLEFAIDTWNGWRIRSHRCKNFFAKSWWWVWKRLSDLYPDLVG